MSKDKKCCDECFDAIKNSDVVRCMNMDCPCHAENEHKEEWEVEFDRTEIVEEWIGHKGEAKPIINIEVIKDFIRRREAKVREEGFEAGKNHGWENGFAFGKVEGRSEVLQEVMQLVLNEWPHDRVLDAQFVANLIRLRSQGPDTTTH